jgi:hypothetical protein
MRIRIDGDGDYDLPNADGERIKDAVATSDDPSVLVEEVQRIGIRATATGEPDLVFAVDRFGDYDAVVSAAEPAVDSPYGGDDGQYPEPSAYEQAVDGQYVEYDSRSNQVDYEPSAGVEDTDRRFG